MLYTQSLFFCRVDKFEDQFEGTVSKPTSDLIKQFLAQPLENDEKENQATSDENFKDVMSHQKKIKSTICINCWNSYDNNESAGLWKIYSNFSKGIMIKSSITKLITALEKTAEDISLSEVQYIDHRNDQMRRSGNFMESFNYNILHINTKKKLGLFMM